MQGLTGRCLGDARDQGDLTEQKTTANFEQLPSFQQPTNHNIRIARF